MDNIQYHKYGDMYIVETTYRRLSEVIVVKVLKVYGLLLLSKQICYRYHRRSA